MTSAREISPEDAIASDDAQWLNRLLPTCGTQGLDELLFRAVYNNSCVCVSLLLQHTTSVEGKDDTGDTPLIVAARKGFRESMLHLLRHGGYTEATDSNGETPLVLAIKHGREHIVSLLLEYGSNTEATDINGNTCIMLASLLGQDQVVSILIAKGCNIRATDANSKTAVLLAAWGFFYQFDPNRPKPLINADGNYIEIITSLLDAVDSHFVTSNAWRVLMIIMSATCAVNSIIKRNSRSELLNEAIKRLINVYSDAEYLDRFDGDEKLTLLMYVSSAGFTDYVKLLLNKGCRVNLTTNDGQTALYWACTRNHLETTECLLNHGADPNIVFKGTPEIVFPIIEGNIAMVRLLIQFGCKTDIVNIVYRGKLYSSLLHINLSSADFESVPKISDLLYKSGSCDNEYMFSLLHSQTMSKISDRNPERMMNLRDLCTHPMSLVNLSRIVISRSLILKHNRLATIDKLPVPSITKSFLKYCDE